MEKVVVILKKDNNNNALIIINDKIVTFCNINDIIPES